MIRWWNTGCSAFTNRASCQQQEGCSQGSQEHLHNLQDYHNRQDHQGDRHDCDDLHDVLHRLDVLHNCYFHHRNRQQNCWTQNHRKEEGEADIDSDTIKWNLFRNRS